jgi:hypothetical protein
LAVLALSAAMASCQGGSTGLVGAKKSDSAHREDGARKSEAGGEAADESEPAVTKDGRDSADSTAEVINEEQHPVAPEVISGAYLTQQLFSSKEEPAPEGTSYYGAQVWGADDERLDLTDYDVTFELKFTADGAAVPATRVALPDVDADAVWAVSKSDLAKGVTATLQIDGDGWASSSIQTCQRVALDETLKHVSCN